MEDAASLASGPDGKKRRYFYEPYIGEGNQRVSQQISTTHNLIRSYQLHNDMEIIRPRLAKDSDFIQFHSSKRSRNYPRALQLRRVGHPGPFFPGLVDYCRRYAGGSLSAASKLTRRETDIAINWSGGMHRAKRDEACGFGYVNDVVLGILELLNVFKRVLYIDIGYYHGDAVQEAFDETDRVMTISFHKHGAQRSGYITDYGAMEVYQPEAIVLQCGPDSLAGDGRFNLTTKGYAACLQYIRSFNVRLMLLGGQGHTLVNVVRCWCYETAVAVGKEIDDDIDINVSYAC
ncbi:hypothetical protein Bca52824_000829 [Brassica carinata]|uniref:histone deacetylase n=1 Tax=Brassica carinata TaxID=52824 RepID=A0A8X8B978_BRACI|nr:hypothetical protein Bca52824_000829 [Brassica carinata]